jgi:hypothetical protein
MKQLNNNDKYNRLCERFFSIGDLPYTRNKKEIEQKQRKD